jgi:ubiquinone/menaquinone biosynthesis C-methylase UbiE
MSTSTAPTERPEILPVETTRQDAQRTYGRLSRIYDWTEGVFEIPSKRRALRMARVRKGAAVLEVGCGPGWALKRLAQAAGVEGTVCGIDLTPGMLREAGRKVPRRVGLARADATRLPFQDGAFDVVFSTFVLELIPTDEIQDVLGEIRRVLKPGGRFAVVTLTRESPNIATRIYEWGHNRFPRLLDCRPIHLRSELEAAGFEIAYWRRSSILGLPIEIAVGRRPESSEGS